MDLDDDTRLAVDLLTHRICGTFEKCFEAGKTWGHMAFIMCEYMRENPQDHCTICTKYKTKVKYYGNGEEYAEVKKMYR